MIKQASCGTAADFVTSQFSQSSKMEPRFNLGLGRVASISVAGKERLGAKNSDAIDQ
jgi:hypothetical protein